jgi:hypothetical protein
MRENALYVVSVLKAAPKGYMYKKRDINCLLRLKVISATGGSVTKPIIIVSVTVPRVH